MGGRASDLGTARANPVKTCIVGGRSKESGEGGDGAPFQES